MGHSASRQKINVWVTLERGSSLVDSIKLSCRESTCCVKRRRTIASVKLPVDGWSCVAGIQGCHAEGQLRVPLAKLCRKDGNASVRVQCTSLQKPVLTSSMPLAWLLDNVSGLHFSLFCDDGPVFTSLRCNGRRCGEPVRAVSPAPRAATDGVARTDEADAWAAFEVTTHDDWFVEADHSWAAPDLVTSAARAEADDSWAAFDMATRDDWSTEADDPCASAALVAAITDEADDAWAAFEVMTSDDWSDQADDSWAAFDMATRDDWSVETDDPWASAELVAAITDEADDSWKVLEMKTSDDWSDEADDSWAAFDMATRDDWSVEADDPWASAELVAAITDEADNAWAAFEVMTSDDWTVEAFLDFTAICAIVVSTVLLFYAAW
ncbi:uncharacterized protein LOC126997205 isoform X2 [Eriocheir sinensis]|uniref:uncharacterized protein LOC126997205 isoform X2 n=1 Tax=Eriocheir sinensis TaxID=95602 RepID=UPI0021C9C321|nr:uncharacterized protein LOC126997205 isoform X2 [Eriocheir sinensis]